MEGKTTLTEFRKMNSVKKKKDCAKEYVVLGFYAAYIAFIYSFSGISDYYKRMVFHAGLVRNDYECNFCRLTEF